MNVTVIGAGRWASFLAWYINKIGHNVTLWGRKTSKSLASLVDTRKNAYVELDDKIELTSDLSYAVSKSDIIVMAISSQSTREVCQAIGHHHNKTWVLCMKGLETSTGYRLSEVLKETLGDDVRVAAWVGPGHPQNMVRNVPNCMVIDSYDDSLTHELVDIFKSSLVRFYYGQDMIGTEVGAASKNVIGLAAGMLDGLEHEALKGVLIARGPSEISRLTCAMGGRKLTPYGLCHLGDYEATLFSPYSHNRRYGESFIKGVHLPILAEGVDTVRSIMFLADKYDVDMPICRAVNKVIYENSDPLKCLSEIFMRDLKTEF